jgi:4'-phosphopantetheinyl transferase
VTFVHAGRVHGIDGSSLHDRVIDEIHVWTTERSSPGQPSVGLLILDEIERDRAARFRRDIERDRYVGAHAFLRRVLAGYLGVAPEGVVIERSAAGKPSLGHRTDLVFNLSHADDLAAVAVVRGRDVGIDIERMRPVVDAVALASAHFTDREAALVRAASAAERDATFLALWTRKESVVKALGGGLSLALDAFDVLADQGSWPPSGPDRSPGPPVSIATIKVPAGYVGAVAVTGPPMPVRHMDRELAS